MLLHPAENPLCLGHEAPQDRFLGAFHSGRLPHGWIIKGPAGVGKRTFCYSLIRLVFSKSSSFEELHNLSPKLPLFRRIASRSHGDLFVLEKREGASSLSVEEVRFVRNFLQRTTVEGGWRIVLLDGLDRLNHHGANALLKSLEEPPPKTLFLLTAQTLGGILPTIRSRCQILSLKPLENEALKRALEQMGYALDHPHIQEILPLARGCIGQMISLLQEERWKKVISFRLSLSKACLPPHHPGYQALFTPEKMKLFTGEPLSFWSEHFLSWLQDLLTQGGIFPDTLTGDLKAVFKRFSQSIWWSRLDQIKEQFERGENLQLDSLHTLSCVLGILTKP